MPLAWDDNDQFVFGINSKTILNGVKKYGVISGLAVSAQTVPDMSVQVSSGYFQNESKIIPSSGSVSVSINIADPTYDRYDLISVNSTGTIVYTAGIAAVQAVPPAIPAGNVALAYILVTTGTTSITNAVIYDLRVFLNNVRYGGDGNEGALNVVSGTTNLSGFHQYSSISVAVGATLNLTGNTVLLCSGSVVIDGNITSSDNTLRVGSSECGTTAGVIVSGSGGSVGQNPFSWYYNRTLFSGGGGGNGGDAYIASTVVFDGGGGGGGGGYGSGGNGGKGRNGGGLATITTVGIGGWSKFSLLIEAYGNISFGSSAIVNLNGANGTDGTTGPNSGSLFAGSGAGGGAAGSNLKLFTLGNISLEGTFNLYGGNGGNGGGNTAGGGGGGGGGLLESWYGGIFTDLSTKNLNGGTAGTGFGSSENGQNGAIISRQFLL